MKRNTTVAGGDAEEPSVIGRQAKALFDGGGRRSSELAQGLVDDGGISRVEDLYGGADEHGERGDAHRRNDQVQRRALMMVNLPAKAGKTPVMRMPRPAPKSLDPVYRA